MRKILGKLALAIVALALGACASMPFDLDSKQDKFDLAQKKYTQCVRWGQPDKAAEFVDPDERAQFLEDAATLADVKFTDWDLRSLAMDPDGKGATAKVVYRAYRSSTLTEVQYQEIQRWTWNDQLKAWTVLPGLADLPRVLGQALP